MIGSLYHHPRIISLILLLIIIAGINSFNTMPRQEDPHMQSRVVQVTTFYPGADAERVEAEITEKLERKMREVPEVKSIMSVSRPDISFITLELEDYVEDAKPITARLRDKVEEVTDLPSGSAKPEFSDTRIYAHSAIIGLTWRSTSPVNYAILGRHAREIESRIRNLSGTDFVDTLGLPEEEIRISIDDQALAAYGYTMDDIALRIRESDARGSAGLVSDSENRMVIQVAGALDTLDRIRRIPIGYDPAGASLRIGDFATVIRTYEDPPSKLAILNSENGVVIGARMYEDSRIDAWADTLGEVIADYEKSMPSSIHIELIFDQRTYADERLDGLMGNLAAGALVVTIVLLFALGWRAALVAASILPLTLLSALALADIVGLRIEQILVTGLIVALGIMVDNAIVITDEIQHLRLKGERRSIAVAKTIKKMWLPLLGSTLTTIIAFMPLILMEGGPGEFLIGVPAAVSFSLIASYIIAFTILSALAGRVVEGKQEGAEETSRIWWRDGVEGKALSVPFRKSLNWSVKNPIKSILVAAALPLLGFYLAGGLTEQFFPKSDRNQFLINLNMPGQASIEETHAAVTKIDEYLADFDVITAKHWYIGTRPPKYHYAMISSTDGVTSAARGIVTVDAYKSISALVPQLQTGLTTLLPEALIIVRELETGPPIQAPIEVRLAGPDLAVLEELGDNIRSIVSQIPDVTYTQASLKAGRPMVSVEAREDDVSVAGLTLSAVERQLKALTTGNIVSYIIEETQQVPVRLIANRDNRKDLNSVANMSLIGAITVKEEDGSFADVPVSAIADVKLITKVGAIQHRNGERINTIQAYLEYGVLPAIPLAELKKRIEDENFELPPGYKLSFGGETEERDEAIASLFGTAGMLVVMMLLCVVLTFNSFRLAYVTLIAAVFSAGLGFLSLYVFGFPLSFVVIFGLMGLIGLAINAAIVILSELRGRKGAREGKPDAVVDGVMATGRHILSTTITTVGGFMPLILAGGPFWPPFAIAIAFGAFLSMIVSFYFAPAAFIWLTRIRPVSTPGEAQSAKAREIAAPSP